MPRQQTAVWSWADSVISRCWFAGRWLLFLEWSWPFDREGSLCAVSRYKTMAILPLCCLSFLWYISASACVCFSLPPPCLSLSLSSSGLIRAGLWREGEMVTVTTAENDGPSGREHYISVYKWLQDPVLGYLYDFVCKSRFVFWKLTAAQWWISLI